MSDQLGHLLPPLLLLLLFLFTALFGPLVGS
jgi:hypothetical protein